jgi:hypothetical protein
MKRGVLILLLALFAGFVSFCAMRWHQSAGHHSGIVLDVMPELEWLRNELKLSDEQFSKVSALHVAYRPKCTEMCRRIAEAHEEIETIAKSIGEVSPEFREALKRHADIHVECQEQMLKHLYETAATLNKEQATRYLEAMLPFALDFSHSESGTLHVR